MKKHRLIGERTPVWLAVALALVGITGGVEAALRIATPDDGSPFRLPGFVAEVAQHASLAIPVPVASDPGDGGTTVASGATAADGSGNLRLAADAWRRFEGKNASTPAAPAPLPQILPPALAPKAEECAPVFGVTFAHGSSGFKTSAFDAPASRLKEWSNKHPNAKIRLDGYTDATGDEEFNLLFSHRRAKAVADMLVKSGIPGWRISTRALGPQPVVAGAPVGELNRRVVMRIDGFPECAPSTTNSAS
ncbi:MAG: OmpA family protein [Defluviicoccus sp.]|nr:OmpA family protein [Defluviicoccus sp.]MDS4073151.1 OmpA family protein [Defluviicoccus sp.]